MRVGTTQNIGAVGGYLPCTPVEPAAQCPDLTSQCFCPNLRAHPTTVRLSHHPDEGFLGRGISLRSVKKQHERLVRIKLSLNVANRQRLGTCRRSILREIIS